MFYVTSLDGSQVEPLINIGTDFRMEQSVDGTFIVSFSCFPDNNPGYDILRSETVITIDDHDFKVKQYSDSAYSKRITATSIFFENSKVHIDSIFSGNHTLVNHLDFIFGGSGWTYTVDSDISDITNYITNFGNDNLVSLTNKVCKYHQIEYIIQPNKNVHFAKLIGGDYDYQYRYKHNVSDVVLVEDTTNLYTYIRGYGKDELFVEWESPNRSTFGKLEAKPIRDDRFTDANSLVNYIKNTISDVPDLVIESRIPELTNRETGERIWLIYEPLKVKMQTRILKQTKTLKNGKMVTESVTLGNTLMKTSTDILVEQQEQINDNKDYIDTTNDEVKERVKEISYRFEETEERMENDYTKVTSEYTSAISMSARALQTEFNEKVTTVNSKVDAQYTTITAEYNSKITQTAQQIRSEMSASVTSIGADVQNVRDSVSSLTQTANSIEARVRTNELNVSSQGSRITSAESSIVQQANQIQSRVSYSDYTGSTITSLINQDPYAVSITANKVNLNGAVVVNGSISGATNISVSNDVTVGNNIYLNPSGSGSKSIIFDGISRIVSNGWNIEISGPSVRIGSSTTFNGPVDFSNSTITGLNANSVRDFYFGYSTVGKLDVYRYGSKIGTVTMA